MNDRNTPFHDAARRAAFDDAARMIESLELPYLEALQQRLVEHIEVRRVADREHAIAEIRRIAAAVGMSVEELATMPSPRAAKYRHPDGREWTGRGKAPKWLVGDRKQYLV